MPLSLSGMMLAQLREHFLRRLCTRIAFIGVITGHTFRAEPLLQHALVRWRFRSFGAIHTER